MVTLIMAAAEGSVSIALPSMKIVVSAVIAMALIYGLAVFSPKIAAFVDRLFGKNVPEGKDTSDKNENDGGYRVYDIYEGEMNLDETPRDDKKD